jgi:hypothetical protein
VGASLVRDAVDLLRRGRMQAALSIATVHTPRHHDPQPVGPSPPDQSATGKGIQDFLVEPVPDSIVKLEDIPSLWRSPGFA